MGSSKLDHAKAIRSFVWHELARVKKNMFHGGVVALHYGPDHMQYKLTIKIIKDTCKPNHLNFIHPENFINFDIVFNELSTMEGVAKEVITTAMLLDP